MTTLSPAMMDRLIHHAEILEPEGPKLPLARQGPRARPQRRRSSPDRRAACRSSARLRLARESGRRSNLVA